MTASRRNSLTASGAKWMTAQRKHDDVRSRASRVKFGDGLHMTASDPDLDNPRTLLAAR